MPINIKDERELLPKPGDSLLEMLEDIKMSQAELAERMGKTASKVNDIISGKEPISVNTSLQLEKVLGVDASYWLNLEIQYREKLSRIEQEEALEECKAWLNTQPTKELKKCGYIKEESKGIQMVDEILKFYGVASPLQWQAFYVDDYVSADFRKSNAYQMTLSSMAAWLRIGEIEMRKFDLREYNKELFKENFPEIMKLVRIQPEDYAHRLQELCLSAGVALVYTMCISKAPISGAARWVGGNPLIQLTDRYKSNDHFWFTFFHEVGHIILHGKKDVFLDEFGPYEADQKKETEANSFANRQLISDDFLQELSPKVTEAEIRAIAGKYRTHPGIVVGRLQHLKIIERNFGNSLKLKINLDEMIVRGKAE
jgi:HTH-type transcriptional regulator / antitoxin HigA